MKHDELLAALEKWTPADGYALGYHISAVADWVVFPLHEATAIDLMARLDTNWRGWAICRIEWPSGEVTHQVTGPDGAEYPECRERLGALWAAVLTSEKQRESKQ